MLEAHVTYEVARLVDGLDGVVQAEVDALFEWLGTVALVDLVEVDALVEAALRIWDEVGPSSGLPEVVVEAATAGHGALAEIEITLGELVRPEDVRAWALLVAGLGDVRAEVIEQVTTSKAYSRLIAHVVYHGVKAYLLTENVLAKKIPGASSLMRLGQRGLGAAAPRLEGNIDAQLIAFVKANIADTVRESERFLGDMVDEELVLEAADEFHAGNAERPIADWSSLVDEESLQSAVRLALEQAERARTTPASRALVSSLVEAGASAFLIRHAEEPIAEVLRGIGIDEAVVVGELTAAVQPGLARAAADGFLHERVRANLAPFYESYRPLKAGT